MRVVNIEIGKYVNNDNKRKIFTCDVNVTYIAKNKKRTYDYLGWLEAPDVPGSSWVTVLNDDVKYQSKKKQMLLMDSVLERIGEPGKLKPGTSIDLDM